MMYISWCLLLVVGVAAANNDIIVTQARDARVTNENEVLVYFSRIYPLYYRY